MTRSQWKGLFIVLEGGEGVGKTTQWSRLSSIFSAAGLPVHALREPGGTPVGDELRRILLDPQSRLTAEAEALLFNASRAQLVSEIIEPALSRGETVLLDRFLLSTYAYQGAGRGLSMQALREMSRIATQGIVPDMTLLLSLPVGEALDRALARSSADRMEQEDHAFHARVAQEFENASTAEWQSAHGEIGYVERIDASGSMDDVTERIVNTLRSRWPDRFEALAFDSMRQSNVGARS
jgi:dTMP kinase